MLNWNQEFVYILLANPGEGHLDRRYMCSYLCSPYRLATQNMAHPTSSSCIKIVDSAQAHPNCSRKGPAYVWYVFECVLFGFDTK